MTGEGKLKHFYNRTEVANYLGVSRMQLYRMEKLVPLTSYRGRHLPWTSSNDIDVWKKKYAREVHDQR